MLRKTKIILGIILGFVGLLIILIVGGIIITLFSSVSQKSGSEEAYLPSSSAGLESSGFLRSKSSDASAIAEAEMPATAAPGESSSNGNTVNLTEKKIIKTGNLEMTVDSVDKTVALLTNVALRAQGFIQSSYVYESASGAKSGMVVMKVPVAQFEIIFKEVKGLAQVVELEQIAGQDVTEEYVDLQAQLKNSRAEEQQYLEIMEKATEVEDILKVAASLSMVREKIERLQGQLQYLASMTDMSTLTIELSEETKVASGIGKWQPDETLKQAFKTLISAFQKTIDRLIWLVVFLIGFFLPLGIIIWLIVKIIKRIRNRNREVGSMN